MKASEFLGKFKSKYLWGNLTAMLVVVILLMVGVRYGLNFYTHHGEAITIPDLKQESFSEAEKTLAMLGLTAVVSDTGYVRTLPPNSVLEQTPAAGEKVKAGRIIYLIINASNSPTIALPDIIDNSSLREAMAKLSAMGFKLGTPQYIPGEKDWVYGIIVRGKEKVTGDRISIEDPVIVRVGNGQLDSYDSIDFINPVYPQDEMESDADGFEAVPEPEALEKGQEPAGKSAEKENKNKDTKPLTPQPALPERKEKKN